MQPRGYRTVRHGCLSRVERLSAPFASRLASLSADEVLSWHFRRPLRPANDSGNKQSRPLLQLCAQVVAHVAAVALAGPASQGAPGMNDLEHIRRLRQAMVKVPLNTASFRFSYEFLLCISDSPSLPRAVEVASIMTFVSCVCSGHLAERCSALLSRAALMTQHSLYACLHVTWVLN